MTKTAENMIDKTAAVWYDVGTESQRAGRLTLRNWKFGGANPPDFTRKEGNANDYIPGFFLVLYTHCIPYQSAVPDFYGKEIAATTAIVTAVIM